MSGTRYAIYFTPHPATALAKFGSSLLGYDSTSGAHIPQTTPEALDAAQWAALTQDPRRYGFHATLKAPFHLAEDASAESLKAALIAFAKTQQPFALNLRVADIGGFIALVPTETPAALLHLEREIVARFDVFRAPLSQAELHRKLKASLTMRQRIALGQFGYPYVMEDFRFHMTLSQRLPDNTLTVALPAIARQFERCVQDAHLTLDSLSLMIQTSPDDPFKIALRAHLTTN